VHTQISIRIIRLPAHNHFLRRQSLIEAAVRRFSSASISRSGANLKLKRVFPCIRFFKSGGTCFVSGGFIYSGIRWKLT